MTVTVQKRVEEFKGELMYYLHDPVSKVMMCRCCNSRVDWVRKSTVDNHCNSASHKAAKTKYLASNSSKKRQISISESAAQAKKLKTEKEEFVSSTTKAFLAANIPLHKLDDPNIRAWMNKYVKGAGDLPKEKSLRNTVVPSIKTEEEEQIKDFLADKNILIECDETTDRRGRAVLIVLLRCFSKNSSDPPKVVVGGVCELSATNARECSRSVIQILHKYEIKYDNVKGLMSDSAAYMTACYKALREIIGDHFLHFQCWAHKLDKINMIPSQILSRLNQFVSNTKKSFKNSRKRRNRYRSFLEDKYKTEDGQFSKPIKLFPLPVMSRWNSWKASVDYISDYCGDLVEFVKSLKDDDVAALKYFKKLSEEDVSIIKAEANFVTEHWSTVSKLLLSVEGSKYPFAHKLYARLSELLTEFAIIKDSTDIPSVLGEKSKACLSDVLSRTKRENLLERFQKVAQNSFERLDDLICSDPAKHFFRSLERLFDTVKMMSPINEDDIADSLKMLSDLALDNNIPLFRLQVAYGILKENVKAALANLPSSSESSLAKKSNKTDVVFDCLKGMLGGDHSSFAGICLNVIFFCVSNTDCERGFSGYGDIVSPKRSSYKVENAETVMYLHFNDLGEDDD